MRNIDVMFFKNNHHQRKMFNIFKGSLQLSNVLAYSKSPHVPVLFEDAVDFLDVGSNKTFIDMTFGAGGHSREILKRASSTKIYALDRDPIAFDHAKLLAEDYPGQITPLLGRFSDLPSLMKQYGVSQKSVDGIIFDFGCSSMQMNMAHRGFSLSKNGFLDMRMGGDIELLTAADVLANITEPDLAKILKVYGDEKNTTKIAKAIVDSRTAFCKVETTKQLTDLVSACVSSVSKFDKLQHPRLATKTFQAIRIFINNELNEINYGMTLAGHFLKKGGRLATISFHSLEDTIVKRHINGNILEGLPNSVPLRYSYHDFFCEEKIFGLLRNTDWKQLHKTVVTSKDEEVVLNTRSRSAKLRVAEMLK